MSHPEKCFFFFFFLLSQFCFEITSGDIRLRSVSDWGTSKFHLCFLPSTWFLSKHWGVLWPGEESSSDSLVAAELSTRWRGQAGCNSYSYAGAVLWYCDEQGASPGGWRFFFACQSVSFLTCGFLRGIQEVLSHIVYTSAMCDTLLQMFSHRDAKQRLWKWNRTRKTSSAINYQPLFF